MSSRPRVALVHDWLVTFRGAERVLETFAELLPDAEIFTLVHKKGALPDSLESRKIHTSFLQNMPLGVQRYRHYLPLMPAAIEALDLSRFDFVLSSSFCVAKGVVTRPDATHVAYLHTPMRYVWEQKDEYFGEGRAGPLTRAVAAVATPWLRAWDIASARRPDAYVANSHHVAQRIRKRYGVEAEVVHPPVDVGRFRLADRPASGRYYAMLGAFAPYKRVDLAIEAFQRMGKRLLIGGGGQEGKRLTRMATSGGPVELVGEVPEGRLAEFLGGARAFVFPGEEDFGIAPVEAQACGTPVLAYGRGGALETVVGDGDSPTGLFFPEQTVDSLVAAVEAFERRESEFDPVAIRAHALRFDRPRFRAAMHRILARERPDLVLAPREVA